jgi:hypothetical protein
LQVAKDYSFSVNHYLGSRVLNANLDFLRERVSVLLGILEEKYFLLGNFEVGSKFVRLHGIESFVDLELYSNGTCIKKKLEKDMVNVVPEVSSFYSITSRSDDGDIGCSILVGENYSKGGSSIDNIAVTVIYSSSDVDFFKSDEIVGSYVDDLVVDISNLYKRADLYGSLLNKIVSKEKGDCFVIDFPKVNES